MEEVWKNIEGFNDQYEVSNTGWVRRKAYYYDTPCGTLLIPASYVSPRISGKSMIVSLAYKDPGSKVAHQPYRHLRMLVADAFIPNPENHSHVRYVDGSCINNAATNLEWYSPNYQGDYDNTLMYKWRVKNADTGEIYDSRKKLSEILGCSYEYLCNRIRLNKTTKYGKFIMMPPEC